MNTQSSDQSGFRSSRLLATAAVLISLAVPLCAHANYADNSAVDIFVATAISYAVIDAAGGFDDNNRHKNDNRHENNTRYHRDDGRYRYRDDQRGRQPSHWNRDRRYWAQHDHRGYKKQSHKRKYHAPHRSGSRRGYDH